MVSRNDHDYGLYEKGQFINKTILQKIIRFTHIKTEDDTTEMF